MLIPSQLSDADENERAWACAAVTNLIQNDPATRRLFQGKNVVGALVERLGDGSDGVVMEASGALRNLAIDAGGEMVAEMFNKGVLGAIRGLVARVSRRVTSGARRIERSEIQCLVERSENKRRRRQGGFEPAEGRARRNERSENQLERSENQRERSEKKVSERSENQCSVERSENIFSSPPKGGRG